MKRFARSFGKKKMRLSLLSFFVGKVVLSADGRYASDILTLCMRYSLIYGELTLHEDGRVYLTASYGMASKIAAVCRAYGIELLTISRRGIREVLWFCLRRPGVLVGVVLAILLTAVSSSHLWEIRVTGNTVLSQSEVIAELNAAGLALGARIGDIDVDSIENRLLMDSERISWITVNLIGNVADVQIREKLGAVEEESDSSPANLVARCDGVIVSCEVLHGNTLVKAGTAVRKGEVLVSGLYDSSTQGYRYTRAEGAVYAETTHEFEIKVPYAYETTAYTGVTGRRYGLVFFGTLFSIFQSDGFSEENAVEKISYIRLFGKELPIGMITETSYVEETVTGEYNPERAMEIAYFRLSREISALPGMQGILEKSLSGEVGEDAYTLKCRVRCIENIAETKNIEIILFD